MNLIYSAKYNLFNSPATGGFSFSIPIRYGIDFNNTLLLVNTTSNTAKSTWDYAGYIKEIGALNDKIVRGKSYKLSLKETRLIELTPLPFFLEFTSKAHWLTQLNIEIFAL